ncbi:metal-dependent phosphohydrolase [Algoriphagus aestuariicola]|jgi:hypothetical protein|uniref:Metal-dependent phosphohydrolase n=1 Tax=Algoriphagus aestuariicola TaxID=1852016 RepID=A0ABS3BQR8_9BACT|nr:Pycsar system effector family protein [Algoriphagus aestuariicola]MBN7801639.1 metal-dependent phosphohydrolase [Algoriphagus aestuariicola]
MEQPTTEKGKDKEKTQRERQTYYRVAFKNNCSLLQIADNKANIIITINSLGISSTVAFLGYGSAAGIIEIDSFRTIGPILLFLLTLLASALLAVQAAKPSIIGSEKTGKKAKSNMLFFGDSAKLSLEEYLAETRNVLGEKGAIIDQMSISLYYQGKILDRKYKLIRRAYEVFVLALAVGILIFFGFLVN